MVDKYDLTIYPCNLWVCTDFEEAKKRFRYKNSKEELEGPLSDDCLALTLALTCCSVEGKRTKDFGFAIVMLSDLKTLGGSKIVEIISHEASHVATGIFAELGIHLDGNNDEPYAYLIGYISSCIWKTVSKIIYKDNNGTNKD